MVTKANPRERPVERSVIRLTSLTGPKATKAILQIVFRDVEGQIPHE